MGFFEEFEKKERAAHVARYLKELRGEEDFCRV